MYSVTVRDHIMIAHSLIGEVFGPAQRVHGATFVVDVEFRRQSLDSNGIVIDIGLATQWLHDLLQPLNYCNLNELPEFQGVNTTTEYLAYVIFERFKLRLQENPAVTTGSDGIKSMKVTLTETPTAWAAYEGLIE